MTVDHHPFEATLLAYASGHLPEGLSLVVATHLAWCAECRDAVAAAETAAGLLLAQGPQAECSDALLARTLGAFVGAIVYKALSIWLVSQTDLSKLVLGGVIVLIVVALPKGIVGVLETLRHRRRPQSPSPAILASRVETAE